MHVNDNLLKYCEFYTECSIEHRVESTLIFIKTTLFIISCPSLSTTINKHTGTSTVHLLPQFLQAGYLYTWPWLDENLFLKACAWFDPTFARIEILIANTSTTYHRDEWLGHKTPEEAPFQNRTWRFPFIRLK